MPVANGTLTTNGAALLVISLPPLSSPSTTKYTPKGRSSKAVAPSASVSCVATSVTGKLPAAPMVTLVAGSASGTGTAPAPTAAEIAAAASQPAVVARSTPVSR